MKRILFIATTVLFLAQSFPAFATKEVVIYTALDQIFSEPILKEFERQTGIHVKAVYDVEAVKTTGLVNRLIAEKKNPRCDVFWNNEIIRTIVLKNKDILTPYFSSAAQDIPAQFKDKDGYWTGFAARARVIVVNTNLVHKAQTPTSFSDLTLPEWQGKAAMANPLFGTTATHISSLYTKMGKEKAADLFGKILKNNTKIVDGNSVVRDMVAAGQVHWGITDTDDVNVGILDGMPIKAILPDQQGDGTLLIPNTIGLIANSPNPKAGKLLIDFLLSREIEKTLSQGESAQIPLREDIEVTKDRLRKKDIRAMEVNFEQIANHLDAATETAQAIFLR